MAAISTRIRRHIGSNVYGLLAVFIALGGTAVALPGKNTVDSGDIRNGQVRGADVRQNTLTGGDINEATLRGVAAAGHNHDAAYAPAGHDHDAAYVNEGQADSVTQGMVSDTERAVQLPISSFVDCGNLAYLDSSSGSDVSPDLVFSNLGLAIQWDDDATADHGSNVCTDLTVPPDYASGGELVIRAYKDGQTGGMAESIRCTVAGAVALVPVNETAPATYSCVPQVVYAPGDRVPIWVALYAAAPPDDALTVESVQWVYSSTG